MSEYYEIPGGMVTLEAHPDQVPLIKHTKDLFEIMQFGDTWRERGRCPMVILPSPTLPEPLGTAWERHKDPSGLLDNIPSHIDCLIVDYANRNNPEFPPTWAEMKAQPVWVVWEYAPRKARFNGTKAQFIQVFGFDPSSAPAPEPEPEPEPPTPPTPPDQTIPTGEVVMHMVCPHCGKLIY